MGRKTTEQRIGLPKGYRNTSANVRAAQWIAQNAYRGPARVTENKTPLSVVVKSVMSPEYVQEEALTKVTGVIFPNPSLKLSTAPQLRSAFATLGPEESLLRLNALNVLYQKPLDYTVAYASVVHIRTSRTPFIVSLYPDAATEQLVTGMCRYSVEQLGKEGAGTTRTVAAGRFATEQQATVASEVLHELLAGTTLHLGPAKIIPA